MPVMLFPQEFCPAPGLNPAHRLALPQVGGAPLACHSLGEDCKDLSFDTMYRKVATMNRCTSLNVNDDIYYTLYTSFNVLVYFLSVNFF